MGTLWASLAGAACAPQPPPRQPLREVCAPMPPCPSVVDALREQRAPLHVHLVDAVSGTSACAEGAVVAVTVFLDDHPVGLGEIRCSRERRGANAPVRVDAKPVTAGLHELRVEARRAQGKVEAASLVSLPAFDITMEGKALVIGAEITVTVGADEITIAPPQVYPPRGADDRKVVEPPDE
ncbi:MAG: hypothetical protein JST00_32415 [Deltaproteobacteria bacterium]|nr:hypothetical protein [Deltaproteobacteria bacterium]